MNGILWVLAAGVPWRDAPGAIRPPADAVLYERLRALAFGSARVNSGGRFFGGVGAGPLHRGVTTVQWAVWLCVGGRNG